MDKPKDYYRILGVSRDASSAAIKRAYRRLAKRYHPDLSANVSHEAFQDLQAAYETLADADGSRRYDEALGKAERLEPLAWSFVRSPAVGDLRRPIRPGSLSGEILLTQAEAANGGVLPLDVPLTTTCDICEGTGGYIFPSERGVGAGKGGYPPPPPLTNPPRVPAARAFHAGLCRTTL